MSTQRYITVPNLGAEFDIGNIETGKIRIKLDLSDFTVAADGTISVIDTVATIVSTVGGNAITLGTDGGAFFDQLSLQAIETVFAGTGGGFITVTPGGTNGHAPVIAVDNAAFETAVNAVIGQTALNGEMTIDQIEAAIAAAITTLVAGDGIVITGGNNIAIQIDPVANNKATVSAQGLAVVPDHEMCDAFGNVIGRAFNP